MKWILNWTALYATCHLQIVLTHFQGIYCFSCLFSRDKSSCRPSPKERLAGSLPGGKTSFCLTGCVHKPDLPIRQTCPCFRPRAGHSVNQSSPHSFSSLELPSEEDASAVHPVGQKIQPHPGWEHSMGRENLWAAQTRVSPEGGPVWGPRLPCCWLFTLL